MSAATPAAAAAPTAAERQSMLETLVSKHNQDHVTGILGESGAKLDRFLDDCIALSATYPGGVETYLSTARRLLEGAKEGANPYLQFTPKVPEGHRLTFGTPEWDAMEEAGLANAATACFVLVAGGLGERLGYNGIKVALPHETATGKCYLQCYAEMILALQAEARRRHPEQPDLKLPLFIMTSGDTHALTTRLLAENGNFGLEAGQLDVVMQELVPALQDSDARIVVDADTGAMAKKPHGHGDVHITLAQSGVAARWLAEGRRTMVFFQDTNGMVMHAVPAFVGATVQGGFAMNSLTVPRRPGEAVGAICNLEHKEDPAKKSLTINVEYNQLGPLLVAVNGEGDVADPDSGGFSPYPGNINVLAFDLARYVGVLNTSGGVVPEFVNPKYADESKTSFIKPTRLECMMQDFPKLLAGSGAKVGFTQVERWTSFSAVKNNNRDAAKKFAATGVAESAATGEASAYYWYRRVLASAGVGVAETAEAKDEFYPGIPTDRAAKVVLAPSVGLTRAAVAAKFPTPAAVRISDRSVLLVEGAGVTVKALDLDGTLVLRAAPGAELVVDGLVVKNDGWALEALSEAELANPAMDERLKIRGYKMARRDQRVVEVEATATGGASVVVSE